MEEEIEMSKGELGATLWLFSYCNGGVKAKVEILENGEVEIVNKEYSIQIGSLVQKELFALEEEGDSGHCVYFKDLGLMVALCEHMQFIRVEDLFDLDILTNREGMERMGINIPITSGEQESKSETDFVELFKEEVQRFEGSVIY